MRILKKKVLRTVLLQNYYGSLCLFLLLFFFAACRCRMVLRQRKVWRNGWPPLPRLENRTRREDEREKENWRNNWGNKRRAFSFSLSSRRATHTRRFLTMTKTPSKKEREKEKSSTESLFSSATFPFSCDRREVPIYFIFLSNHRTLLFLSFVSFLLLHRCLRLIGGSGKEERRTDRGLCIYLNVYTWIRGDKEREREREGYTVDRIRCL